MVTRSDSTRRLWTALCVIGLCGTVGGYADGQSSSEEFNQKAARYFTKEYTFHQWREEDHIIDGEDWSLPPWVKASRYSGIQNVEKKVPDSFPGRHQHAVTITWREIEPQEGTFDFSDAKRRILEASQGGKFAVKIGLQASVWETRYFRSLDDRTIVRTEPGSAPLWIRDYDVPLIEERPNASAPFQVVNCDIYHPEYHKRYLKAVAAFGRSGIPQMPEVDICYLHLKSASRGEEGAGPPPGDPQRPLFEERLRAWAAAFRGVEYKLCLVSHREEDLELAIKLGMGQRNGFVEHYMLHAPNPGLGQLVDEEGYLVVDESHPLIAENRASGDENEEYRNEVRFGPIETFPHRYHESMLRVLQMRRNFLWAEGGPWLINPPLLHYVALELGKTVDTAPDAWCYLRESNVRDRRPETGGKPRPIKNFERWLFQRDAPGAVAEPCEKVDVPEQMFEFHRDHLYDYTARRTNIENGQREIRFGIDDRFLFDGPHRVAVKVTYFDRDDATWELIYHTGAHGELEGVRRLQCGHSGKLRTVTWILDDAWFPAEGYRGCDLAVRAVEGDAVVRMVRVIKLNPVACESQP
ncbi:hypothetical protein JCM19992_27650 [Thermostilla marina]